MLVFHLCISPASPFGNDSQTQISTVGKLTRNQLTRPVSTLKPNPVLGVDFGIQKQGSRKGPPLWGALPLTPFWVSLLAPWTGLALGTKVTHQVEGRPGAKHTSKTEACAVLWLALLTVPCLGSCICITSVMGTPGVMSGQVVNKLLWMMPVFFSLCELTITIEIRRLGGK